MKKMNIGLCGLCFLSLFSLTSCNEKDFFITYNYELNEDKESYSLYFKEDYNKNVKETKKDLLSDQGFLSNEITELNIPSTYLELPVTRIYGFDKNKVTPYGDGLQHMMYSNYSKIKEVTLPDNLEVLEGSFLKGFALNFNEFHSEKYIKSESNDYFYLLKSESTANNIELHSDCVIIGSNAFESLDFSSIELPEHLKSINRYAFSGCYNLESVTLPDSLLYIGDYALRDSNYSSICIPSNVNSIGIHPFNSSTVITTDENNANFANVDNIVYDKKNKMLIQLNNDALIPDDCLIIGKNAFSKLNREELTIPENVIKIEDNEIRGVDAVYLPSNLEEVGNVGFFSKDVYYPSTIKNFKKLFSYIFDSKNQTPRTASVHCKDGIINLEEIKNENN